MGLWDVRCGAGRELNWTFLTHADWLDILSINSASFPLSCSLSHRLSFTFLSSVYHNQIISFSLSNSIPLCNILSRCTFFSISSFPSLSCALSLSLSPSLPLLAFDPLSFPDCPPKAFILFSPYLYSVFVFFSHFSSGNSTSVLSPFF